MASSRMMSFMYSLRMILARFDDPHPWPVTSVSFADERDFRAAGFVGGKPEGSLDRDRGKGSDAPKDGPTSGIVASNGATSEADACVSSGPLCLDHGTSCRVELPGNGSGPPVCLASVGITEGPFCFSRATPSVSAALDPRGFMGSQGTPSITCDVCGRRSWRRPERNRNLMRM